MTHETHAVWCGVLAGVATVVSVGRNHTCRNLQVYENRLNSSLPAVYSTLTNLRRVQMPGRLRSGCSVLLGSGGDRVWAMWLRGIITGVRGWWSCMGCVCVWALCGDVCKVAARFLEPNLNGGWPLVAGGW